MDIIILMSGSGTPFLPLEGAKLTRDPPERPYLHLIPSTGGTPALHRLCMLKGCLWQQGLSVHCLFLMPLFLLLVSSLLPARLLGNSIWMIPWPGLCFSFSRHCWRSHGLFLVSFLDWVLHFRERVILYFWTVLVRFFPLSECLLLYFVPNISPFSLHLLSPALVSSFRQSKHLSFKMCFFFSFYVCGLWSFRISTEILNVWLVLLCKLSQNKWLAK